jgi:outer membrane protein OmpA-like peptidoglycan-associated protein
MKKIILQFVLFNVLTAVASANMVGSQTQNFNPVTSGEDFVTVHSTNTLKPGTYNLGLFLDASINTLPIIDGDEQLTAQSRTSFHDTVTSSSLHMAAGVTSRWELGLRIPFVLHQYVNEDQSWRGDFSTTGLMGLGIDSKLKVWNNDKVGIAIVGTVYLNQMKDNPYAGKGAGPTFMAEIVTDVKLNPRWLWAFNLGYRVENSGEPISADTPIDPIDNQILWSSGLNYHMSSQSKMIGEIFGSIGSDATKNLSDRQASAAEMLLAYRHIFKHQIELSSGVGTEIIHGQSTPDWRLFTGINWKISKKERAQPLPPPPPLQRTQVIAVRPSRGPVIRPTPKFQEGPLGPIKLEESVIVRDILFAFNSDKLKFRGQNISIVNLASHLNAGPGFKRLIIVGHTDDVGSDQYNIALSYRRAKAIRQYLINNYKIDPRKVTALGKGEREPVSTNATERGRQLNRRVEFRIFR